MVREGSGSHTVASAGRRQIWNIIFCTSHSGASPVLMCIHFSGELDQNSPGVTEDLFWARSLSCLAVPAVYGASLELSLQR